MESDDSIGFEELGDQLMTYTYEMKKENLLKKEQKPKNIKQKNCEQSILNCKSIGKKRSQKAIFTAQPEKNQKNINNNGNIIRIGDATFKSNFESGSLSQVYQTNINTFSIYLQNQVNSNRISSWFYYNVEGLKGQINFVICGFNKSTSLYNQGMKICCKDSKNGKWKRAGSKISYEPVYDAQNQIIKGYQLKFTYFFHHHSSNSVQFAYCFPYTYTRLIQMIGSIIPTVKIQSLGRSYQGREIPMLTIGSQASSHYSIVLSARVHPGQTVSSHIIEGFIKELLTNSCYAQLLRQNFLIRVVPMINVDGVIRGNYRFSAKGCDLNRKWKKCKITAEPEIYYLKNMLQALNKQKKILAYIDIHGHSRKKHAFFYGCCRNNDGNINAKPKQFPYLMSKISSSFKYEYCSFAIQKDKIGTARVCMWNELKIDHVYTLQSTFCGPQGTINYLQNDYDKMGRKLCEGLATYFYTAQKNPSLKKEELKNDEYLKMATTRNKITEQLYQNSHLLQMGMNDDSGSDSDPQAGQIAQTTVNNIAVQKNIDCNKSLKKSNYIHERHDSYLKKNPLNHLKQRDSMNGNGFTLEQINIQNKERASTIFKKQSKDDDALKNSGNAGLNGKSEQLSLNSSILKKKNHRVHSKHNNRMTFDHLKYRISSEQDDKIDPSSMVVPGISIITENNGNCFRVKGINRNLMRDCQGVQYRRIRKLAEKKNISKKKSPEQKNKKYLFENNMKQTNLLAINHNKTKTITPFFYPNWRQKQRRQSFEMNGQYISKQQTFPSSSKHLHDHKICINGDEVNCTGTKIYF